MTPHPINLIPKRHAIIKRPAIPTKQHVLRVKQLLECNVDSTILYMRGGIEGTRDNTDVDLEFRQESNFFYLTGIEEPGFQVVVDLEKERIYLIMPNVPESDIFWKGPNDTSKELLEKYDVDEIVSQSDLPRLIATLQADMSLVLDKEQGIELLKQAPLILATTINTQYLKPALDEARLIKFPWEVDMIRQAMYGSSQAHIALMQQYKFGMTETHLAALFRWICASHQIYKQAYLPIVASGPRAATLHYTKNNQLIPTNNPHTLVLVDAGGEKSCYSSDITRTFPVHGKFSDEAKAIYTIVLKIQEAVLSQLKPGVLWSDMQQLAIKILCIELGKIGILKCDDEDQLEELVERNIPSAFYYHGLGHTLGLDVHDVGGLNASTQSQHHQADEEDPTREFLYNRPLEKNMVLTVEPGLYFNDAMLDIWIQYPSYGQYFDLIMLAKYREVGGVRIEDTIVITQDGYENLTSVPKQIHEIESLMACDLDI